MTAQLGDGTAREAGGGPEDDVEMGFFEHLGELRVRLMRAVWGILPGVGAAWVFKEELLAFLLDPYKRAYAALGFGEPEIFFTSPTEFFLAYLKIALVVGLLAATPWVFWQIWAFISPGLYRREKFLALPFIFFSTLCFAGGAFFGYGVVFPLAFEFLLGMGTSLSEYITVKPTIMVGEYLTFATRMLLAFGVVFELPVVLTFLSAARIVNWVQLMRFGRWFVVIAAVVSAMLTPPDVASQLLMIGPLVLLYFLSIGLAFLFGEKVKPGSVPS